MADPTATPALPATAFLDRWDDILVHYGLRIVLALLLAVVGVRIARYAARRIEQRLLQRPTDRLLADFIATSISIGGAVMVTLAALQMAGIPTSSFLAALGAAGLAVGLALKDSLAQLAAGVMLIVLRPFRAGEYIFAAGQEGIVESVHLFQTVLRSADNRLITLPNGSITTQPIVNTSRCATRRADLNIWVSPDSPVEATLRGLREAVAGDPRILREPPPFVAAGDMGERGVLLVVQVWGKAADLGNAKSDLIVRIQHALDAAGAHPIGPAQPLLRWTPTAQRTASDAT